MKFFKTLRLSHSKKTFFFNEKGMVILYMRKLTFCCKFTADMINLASITNKTNEIHFDYSYPVFTYYPVFKVPQKLNIVS